MTVPRESKYSRIFVLGMSMEAGMNEWRDILWCAPFVNRSHISATNGNMVELIPGEDEVSGPDKSDKERALEGECGVEYEGDGQTWFESRFADPFSSSARGRL